MDETGEQPRARGSVTSGAAAFALVFLAVAGWWLFSGNGPQGPAGNDSRFSVPDVDAVADGTPTDAGPSPTVANGVRIEGYAVDGLRLTVSYRIDVSCTPAPEPTRVLETDAAVTVTLVSPPAEKPERSCDGTFQERALDVLLDSDLEGRSVLDGSVSPQVLVEGTALTE